jgi:hypothetical protein
MFISNLNVVFTKIFFKMGLIRVRLPWDFLQEQDFMERNLLQQCSNLHHT